MKKCNYMVSIIVPVYNAMKTIDNCVNSLINQTYSNIEIILVDDGSTDNSLNIIRKYSKQYKNVKCFTKLNGGAGSARNLGLEKSNGVYVTFVDSDDKLSNDAIKNMIETLDNNTDIVIGGFKICNTNEKVLSNMIPQDNYWTQFKFTSTVFKLYRRKFLIDNNIFYQKFPLFEDLCFCLSAYSRTNRIKVNFSQDYIVYQHSDSFTANVSSKPIMGCYDVLNYIYNNVNLSKYNNKTIEYFFIKTLILNVFVQLPGHNSTSLHNVFLRDYNYVKSLNIRNKNICFNWEKHETLFINIIVNVFILFCKLHISKILIRLLKIFKR